MTQSSKLFPLSLIKFFQIFDLNRMKSKYSTNFGQEFNPSIQSNNDTQMRLFGLRVSKPTIVLGKLRSLLNAWFHDNTLLSSKSIIQISLFQNNDYGINHMKVSLLVFACVLSALLPLSICVLGIDHSERISAKAYRCIKRSGYKFSIVRGFRSFGEVDRNAKQSLAYAKTYGLFADIYMFPCRGKCPITQLENMMDQIPSYLYGMIWIDVETNPSNGCSWNDYSHESNCHFIMDIINGIETRGKKCGIYTSRFMWENIVGSRYGCKQAAQKAQLWYAHYDDDPSFSDFGPFGGWKLPNIKQYKGDTKVCGASVDLNYY